FPLPFPEAVSHRPQPPVTRGPRRARGWGGAFGKGQRSPWRLSSKGVRWLATAAGIILGLRRLRTTMSATTPVTGRPQPAMRRDIFPVAKITQPADGPSSRRTHKVIAVMPAYNAETTLVGTVGDIPAGAVDEVILVDDKSADGTVSVARQMGLTVIEHPEN